MHSFVMFDDSHVVLRRFRSVPFEISQVNQINDSSSSKTCCFPEIFF